MRKIAIFIAVLILILTFVSCAKKTKEAAVTEEGVAVNVVKPKTQDIVLYYNTSSTITNSDVRTLSFSVPGQIQQVLKEEGEKITQGEVVATLNRETYLNGLKAAESGLESAKNGLKAAEQGKRAAKNQLENAENQLAQVEKDYERFKRLRDDNVISQKEFEQIELGYKSAKLGVDSARSALRMAETQVASAEEGVKAATAQVAVVRKQYADASIIAPFSGSVNKKFVTPGVFINPGEPVFEVVSDGKQKIEASLPERFLKDIKEGSSVLLTIPNNQCNMNPQKVTRVNNEIDPNTGNFGVTIELEDLDGCLRHGMFATLDFEISRANGAMSLPIESIIELGGQKIVYVNENNKAKKKVVEIGLASKDLIEITSGLQGNEDVIFSGNRYVVDGSPIRVIEQAKSTESADTNAK